MVFILKRKKCFARMKTRNSYEIWRLLGTPRNSCEVIGILIIPMHERNNVCTLKQQSNEQVNLNKTQCKCNFIRLPKTYQSSLEFHVSNRAAKSLDV